ncbi:elongation of very long chain fatty acids protein 4-like [Gigantopelta aegis]|uniref:elongation of very long chain fatty acids protein 4-like n=1 Tax=Gigantopelta aegis TaxID=1735272 RepID=UPI001B888809|nr:elongation of very long chain fatty acids protein 4-like [Gigantopelta aegis]
MGFQDMYDRLVTDLRDPRTDGWFMMSTPWPTLAAVTIYILFVSFGRKFMACRQPFELKNILICYNFCLVLLSAILFEEFLVSAWFRSGFSLVCEPVNGSNDPMSIRLANACWWFYFSKIIELLDTIFFVLRKKNNQISFLHVYHHTTMPILWWVGVKFVPGGESYFSASINSFIHILMYTYYLLSAFGPRMQKYLWWKKYMTTLQLLQFWAILLHTIQAMYVSCGFPVGYGVALITYMVSHIILFSNFYYQTYHKKARLAQKTSENTNHVANGFMNGYDHHKHSLKVE